jgi:hypothetical protein
VDEHRYRRDEPDDVQPRCRIEAQAAATG